MEIIKKITDNGFKTGEKYCQSYDGYIVETDKQKILVGIDDESQCCESWGYVSSIGDDEDFIGAKLIKVEVVDSALDKVKVELDKESAYDGEAMFVNFETDRGTFQLAVYNAHNGYYSHGVLVKGFGLDYREHI